MKNEINIELLKIANDIAKSKNDHTVGSVIGHYIELIGGLKKLLS